jgi:flavin-dependent thymidylate synthase
MKNSVELLGHYGSDQIIAQSAWTSTSRDLTTEKIERIPKLIVGLWADGHETPFEKGTVHFMVNCDIASHIHLLKHRLSSLNGESARYKELKEDKYYLPGDWDEIYPSGDGFKFGSDWKEILEDYTTEGSILYHQCLADLTPVLGRKRAKESARFFKTYNSQIECDVMFNLRSFANFLQLRNSEHAQLEIREIAAEMQGLVEAIDDAPFQFALGVIIKSNELWVEKRKEVKEDLLNHFFGK